MQASLSTRPLSEVVLFIMLWTLHHQQSEFIQPQTADDYKCISDETPVKTLCL